MTLDISKLPADIMRDLRQRGHTNDEISAMTANKAFNEWCDWNGFTGWGWTLYRALKALERAEGKR